MKSLRLLVAGFCIWPFISIGAPKAPEPPAVELLADAPWLQPSSTLEFRFTRPMVSRDEIGLVPKQSPVVIAPAVAGKLTWLSRRSGGFVPGAPWPAGKELGVTVRRSGN